MANNTYTMAQLNSNTELAQDVRDIAHAMINGTYNTLSNTLSTKAEKTAARIVELKTGKKVVSAPKFAATFEGMTTPNEHGEVFAQYSGVTL